MKTKKQGRAVAAVVMTAIVFGFSGCSGGSSTDNSPSPSKSADFGGLNGSAQQALNTLSTILGSSEQPAVAIGGEETGGETTPVSGSVACDLSGTVDYGGSVSEDSAGNGAFDMDLSFKSCDGITGELALEGSIFEDDLRVDARVAFDGQLEGDGCSLSFSGLELTKEGEFSDGVTETANGGISAVCGEDRFACSFDHVDMSDSTAMEAACTCAGAGCDFFFSVELSNDDDGDEEGPEDTDDSDEDDEEEDDDEDDDEEDDDEF